MTTSEIDFQMSSTPEFNGVYPKDLLINEPTKGCYICNMDDSDGPGTHWVAVYFGSDRTLYLDSFGKPPASDELLSWLKSAGKPFQYNSSQLQDLKSSMCGWWCCMVLQQLVDGIKPYDVMYQFSLHPKQNDKIVQKYFDQSGGMMDGDEPETESESERNPVGVYLPPRRPPRQRVQRVPAPIPVQDLLAHTPARARRTDLN